MRSLVSFCWMSLKPSRTRAEADGCVPARSRAAFCMSLSSWSTRLRHLVLLVGKLARTWASRSCRSSCARVAEGLPQALLEVLLLILETFGALRQIVHLRGRLLLAHAVHHALRFRQTFGGAARFGLRSRRPLLAGLLRRLLRRAHVVQRLIEAIERLLQLLLVLLILLALLIAALLAALLAGLPGASPDWLCCEPDEDDCLPCPC